MKPFLKWAGGKRWFVENEAVDFPEFTGKYIEPFLGGGAVFFHLKPERAILADINPRLIETYIAIRDEWQEVEDLLHWYQNKHSKDFYYEERSRKRNKQASRAAQFLYLNRTCWNGLYRENLKGEFNVPIGTKDKIIFENENFEEISNLLQNKEIVCQDFEQTLSQAEKGDFIFVDPPYTTAHNMNGFVKYNQNIFSWDDQARLCNSVIDASKNEARIFVTNADHESIQKLYNDISKAVSISRQSVISGKAKFRKKTTEALFVF